MVNVLTRDALLSPYVLRFLVKETCWSGAREFPPVWATYPQGDMGRLHRLLHHGEQLLAQLIQVHLIAQRGTESGGKLGGVILAAIEATVNLGLDAPV